MFFRNRKLLVGLLLTLLLLCLGVSAYAATATVSVKSLMLREEPSTKSEVLQTLEKGDKLDVIYKDGSWYKVKYGKYTGYVYGVHVKVSGSVQDADEVVTLKRGSYGADVKKLQERLKELGYFEGSTTYTYGEITEAAVKAFQKRNGLTADGIAGKKTQDKLYSSSAKKAAASSTANDSDDDTLRKGMTSSDVKKLQERLKELGYFNHSVTGYYGDVTADAVKAFQKRNGLTADGVAGKSTLQKLNSSSAKKAEDDKVEANTNTELREGDSGTQVKLLQERLKELGYFNTYCTGTYGDITKDAVTAFQLRNGLSADGIAGKSTLKKLYSSSAKEAGDGSLQYGDQSSEVKKMQQRLKELGYFDTTCTGYFGGVTETALKAFQKRNSLTVDGKAGTSTLSKLYSSSAKAAQTESSQNGSTNQNNKEETKETVLKQGDRSDEVKTLQTRLKALGYFNDNVTGYFGSKTEDAVKAFQARNSLTVNGVANEATVKKLLSSSAVAAATTTYKTERLDWFNGGSSKIPRNAVIKIKDVRTGLVFTGKVLYGSNHLDVEPLTAADTAILLKINGGEFSYKRRPMLVLYSGHVYACSIYSEPHGDQSIYNNNFDGQFCLHFYGSKTHGTDRVDEDHAECERYAYLYGTW